MVGPLAGVGLLLTLAGGPARAQPQTPFGCTNNSYLFQGNPTAGYLLDFASGQTVPQGTNNGNNGYVYNTSMLNAFGYNPVDGYIWSQYNNTTQLVRVGTKFVGKAYPFTQPSGYSQTTFTVGDVDVNGLMYMTRGGSNEGINNPNTDVYIIDLKQTTTPFTASVLSFRGYRTFLTDWAFSPQDSCLYAINTYFNGNNYQYNESNTKIYRFVTHTRKFNGVVSLAGTRETLGVATGGSTPITPSNFASAFMDGNGSFYVVASSTNTAPGLVYRIDRPDLLPAVPDASAPNTSIPATYLGSGNAGLAGNVDGARCAFSKPTSGALPVQLTAFTATAAPPRRVYLTWATANEANNAYFDVQHSLDGHTFATLGQVAGHGTSAQASTYAYTDAAPGAATTHYYRLRQVDLDGSSTYSPVRTVSLAVSNGLVQLAVVPNPAAPSGLRAHVQYAGSAATPATLTLQSLLGQTVLTQPVTLQPGDNVLTPAGTLLPGAYWLSLRGDAALGQQGLRVLVAE